MHLLKHKNHSLSISAQLAFRFTFILAAVVILLTISFSKIQIADLNNERNNELDHFADFIEHSYDRHLKETPDEPYLIKRYPRHINFAVYTLENNEVNIITSSQSDIATFKLTQKKAKIISIKNADNQDYKIIYIARPLNNHNEIYCQIWIDLQHDSLYQMKKALPRMILVSIIPILIICFFIAYSIAKNSFRPVVKMTESAKLISSSNLDSLIPVSNNGDELDRLAHTFNDLFNRLKIDFDRERQFTSDVSHELKTPVAVILGQANLLRRWGKDDPAQLDKSISTIISETKSMEAIIQNLLQMTRIESKKIIPEKENFPAFELTSKIKTELEALDPGAVINFTFNDNIELTSDYELLHQVLMIIISNSLKFCPKPLVIDFKIVKDNSNTTITISDNGPGFSAESIDHVFERFYRGDDSHTRSVGGSGLGLSIARTIIQSLDGTITASNRKDKNGAEIKITL